MQRKIRLIASDVDNTLVPAGGTISEETREAVKLCTEHGVPFVIATGRRFDSAKLIVDALGLAEGYMIIANGAAVVDFKGNVLQDWCLTREESERAYEHIKKHNVMINAFAKDYVYRINTKSFTGEDKELVADKKADASVIDDCIEDFEKIGLESPYKLEVYSNDAEVIEQLRGELQEMGYSVSSAYAENLEIMAEDAGKGLALLWLASHLGLTPMECAAFGDYLNDLQMLQVAGLPIAMRNGSDTLKQYARYIAPPCDQNGVAISIMAWEEEGWL
ncbi:MAG: Cof-type HAD-IIB family hydrolase [Clostridia bacterium]|nr:Cof-type HAD-IIB family hydrolase [Clostridia bacterium]